MKNIIIKEDTSYLSITDLQAVKNGIAKLGIQAIRLDRHFTKKEKINNRLLADSMSKEDWSQHCDQSQAKTSRQIEKIVDVIHDNFIIYQYKNENVSYSNDDWDLFFWCNKGDMSHVRLSPNKRRTHDQQKKDVEKVVELIKTVDCEGIKLSIQYTVHYDNKKVDDITKQVYDTVKNTFITYAGMEGKVKKIGKNSEGQITYGFFKKGAKTKYYKIPKEWFLKQVYGNERK